MGGNMVNTGMTTGRQQGYEGKGRRVGLQKNGINMALQMTHTDPGNIQRQGKCLRKGKADQQ